MNNSGSTDLTPEPNSEEKNRSVPLPVLVAGLLAVLFILFIGIEVLPVLYAVLFPPLPPFPDNLTLSSHTNQEYGTDDWVYVASQPSCQVAKFYLDKGGICQIAPECNPPPASSSGSTSRTSQCTGQMIFSIFAMHWQVSITPQFDQKSKLDISRQIFWTGAITTSPDQPAATP